MYYHYATAISRNLGWVTAEEQHRLHDATVAIAGLGGVGGSHLLTLTRLGVGGFHLADFDTFGLENFNRQAGARLTTIGKSKLDTLVSMALAINPSLRLKTFAEGVTEENVGSFLDDVDCYVDGLDFFALDIRRLVFSACQRRGIAAITAAPLGMGAALLTFVPGSMSFEDYFGFEDGSHNEDRNYLRFLLGLAPRALHRPALVLPQRIDLKARKGPSTAMGCEMCASLAGSQVLKILCNRGPLKAAPWAVQWDGYSLRQVTTWRPGGARNPLNRFQFALAWRSLRSRIDTAE